MIDKFKKGPGYKKLNRVIDDVAKLTTQTQGKRQNQTFGVVRCFLLTDTSVEPMIATGVLWDGSAWVESGLGDAVEVYPNPNTTIDSYADDQYVFARNFGGQWFIVGGSGGTGIRKAYAIADADGNAYIDCYLDVDDSGSDTIRVYCEIADGGTALNAAIPRLVNGEMITVWNDNGTWRSIMTFQKTGTC